MFLPGRLECDALPVGSEQTGPGNNITLHRSLPMTSPLLFSPLSLSSSSLCLFIPTSEEATPESAVTCLRTFKEIDTSVKPELPNKKKLSIR